MRPLADAIVVALFLIVSAAWQPVQGQLVIPAISAPAPSATSSCGTTPGPATNAGFTTCLANYDFSQPFYATIGNWLDCSGNTNSSLPWHAGTVGVPTLPTPLICAGGAGAGQNTIVANDASYGTNTFQLTWFASYSSKNCSGIGCGPSVETAMNGYNGSSGGPATATFPLGFYVETNFRITATYNDGGAPTRNEADVWSWSTSPSGNSGLEFDVGELVPDSNGYGFDGILNWNPPCAPCGSFLWSTFAPDNTHIPAGYAPTAPHKYGYLLTFKSSAAIWACEWIDDVFQSCKTTSGTIDTNVYTSRRFLIMSMNGGLGGAPYSPIDLTASFRYVRVWGCGTGATTQCPGTTLVTGDATHPTYWAGANQ